MNHKVSTRAPVGVGRAHSEAVHSRGFPPAVFTLMGHLCCSCNPTFRSTRFPFSGFAFKGLDDPPSTWLNERALQGPFSLMLGDQKPFLGCNRGDHEAISLSNTGMLRLCGTPVSPPLHTTPGTWKTSASGKFRQIGHSEIFAL